MTKSGVFASLDEKTDFIHTHQNAVKILRQYKNSECPGFFSSVANSIFWRQKYFHQGQKHILFRISSGAY